MEASLESLRLKNRQRQQLARRLEERRAGRRASPVRHEERRRLDEVLLSARAARQAQREAGELLSGGSWLRLIRQTTGIPAKEVARRLSITKWNVFRLEKAERSACIQLSSLRRAAEALDCELVYAIVPREGTLEELAGRQRQAVEEARQAMRSRNAALRKQIDKELDWEASLRRALLSELRKAGIRVR